MDLLLFHTTVGFAQRAAAAGVAGLIVDWENQDKHARQAGHDTEVNRHTVVDLDEAVALGALPVTVRVNGLAVGGGDEIARALDHGATTIMLPMARSAGEVEEFLARVDGRARTLVQIETRELAEDAARLARLPWDEVFIGLNDLMISRGGRWLWEPLWDGTVERLCGELAGRRHGFGGVTVIGGGHPLRFTDLLREYARLDSSLCFLRRTFQREAAGRDLELELAAVRTAWAAARARDAAAVEADRREFYARLGELRPRP
jgi:hypothetical protein